MINEGVAGRRAETDHRRSGTCGRRPPPPIGDQAVADEHFDGHRASGLAWRRGAGAPQRDAGLVGLIAEGREAIGGTWDSFRYPGVRSDSDMYTLGYAFKPWTNAKAIADGPAILDRARRRARERRRRPYPPAIRSPARPGRPRRPLDRRGDAPGARTVRITAGFLFLCGGYYSYQAGYTPDFAGVEAFEGRIVHPQAWPRDLDYVRESAVVIGSGATAVTLVPELAKAAAHVTMLQRSPTHVVSVAFARRRRHRLRRCLPARLAYAVTRWGNILLSMYFYRLTRTKPCGPSSARSSTSSASSLASTTMSRPISLPGTTPGTSGSASRPMATSSAPSARASPRW